ncbi:hypothetical protein AOLI_G00313030 [Acnodon oligacanthus]
MLETLCAGFSDCTSQAVRGAPHLRALAAPGPLCSMQHSRARAREPGARTNSHSCCVWWESFHAVSFRFLAAEKTRKAEIENKWVLTSHPHASSESSVRSASGSFSGKTDRERSALLLRCLGEALHRRECPHTDRPERLINAAAGRTSAVPVLASPADHTVPHWAATKETRSITERGAPTWLEHTLEIKDDQNAGSQTSGQRHPADPTHPHQVQERLFHGWRSEAERRAACPRPRRGCLLAGWLAGWLSSAAAAVAASLSGGPSPDCTTCSPPAGLRGAPRSPHAAARMGASTRAAVVRGGLVPSFFLRALLRKL